MRHLFLLLVIISFTSCKSSKSQNATIEKNSSILIRWSEKYGSVCCERDPQHNNHILDYIKKFESENNLVIKDSYKFVFGREGEAYYCLTLNNLTNKQRELFILNRYLNITKKREKELLDRIKKLIPIEEVIAPSKFNDFTKFN